MINNNSFSALTQEYNNNTISYKTYCAIVEDYTKELVRLFMQNNLEQIDKKLNWGQPFLEPVFFDYFLNTISNFDLSKITNIQIFETIINIPCVDSNKIFESIKTKLFSTFSLNFSNNEDTLLWFKNKDPEYFEHKSYPNLIHRWGTLLFYPETHPTIYSMVAQKNPEVLYKSLVYLSEQPDNNQKYTAHDFYAIKACRESFQQQPQQKELIQSLALISAKKGNSDALLLWLELGATLPTDNQTISNIVGKDKIGVLDIYLKLVNPAIYNHSFLKSALHNCKTKTEGDLGGYKPILKNILDAYNYEQLLSLSTLFEKKESSKALEYCIAYSEKLKFHEKLNHEMPIQHINKSLPKI